MDYGFELQGKVFTPNQTPGITPAENEERNKAIEQAELAEWDMRPRHQLAYFHFPAEESPLFGKSRVWREIFRPLLHSYVNQDADCPTGRANMATVTTWTGRMLGTIIDAHVYRHNLGGRFVYLRVRGTNGAEYYGRASYDGGSCIQLHRAKSQGA